MSKHKSSMKKRDIISNVDSKLVRRRLVTFRMANARDRAEQADSASLRARQDSDIARLKAKEFAPEFHQPGIYMITINFCHEYSRQLNIILQNKKTKQEAVGV